MHARPDQFLIVQTNDSELDGTGPRQLLGTDTVVAYLEANPRHAVVLHEFHNDDSVFTYDPPVYILRGASETLNNFYYGDMPAEDPNDANGGDLTAEEALHDTTIDLPDN
jgi:hypothetical protein